MNLLPHPRFDVLRQKIADEQAVLRRRWKGLAYRCTSLEFARADMLISGEGTRKYGARWMAPHAERVVHLSTTEMTAVQEAKGHYVRYGLDAAMPEPRVLVTLELKVIRLLDLFRFEGLRTEFSLQQMLEEDWEQLNQRGEESLSQALGRAAFSLEYEAILTPSALLHRRRNLAIFPENLTYFSRFEIAHEHTLRQWLG